MSLPTRTVGILGGMGPAACVGFMQSLITKATKQYGACCDQDHVHCIVEQRPLPDRTEAICGTADQQLKCGRAMQDMCASLAKTERVDFVVCVCNTAHFFAPYIVEGCGDLPFLNLIDLTTAKVASLPLERGKVGVLGTAGCNEAQLYQTSLAEAGLEPYTLSADWQDQVMQAIYAVKAGNVQKAVAIFGPVLDHLVEQDCEAAVLGCTEFPLIMEHMPKPKLTLIDSTDTLADAVVAICKGKRPLPA